MKKIYEVEMYQTTAGEVPFEDWLLSLKDKRGQAKLYARIDRASFGNFGDWKIIEGAKNIFEMREHSGAGYRIYYTIIGQKIILLLVGSTKKDQDKIIKRTKEYLEDYNAKNI